MEQETVVDCLVVLDGQNPSFKSYMTYDNACLINQIGGLANAEQINLKETDDRPIPQDLKEGRVCIQDVLVKLDPNVCYYLN